MKQILLLWYKNFGSTFSKWTFLDSFLDMLRIGHVWHTNMDYRTGF